MKKIFILTDRYPYGDGEPFLHTELQSIDTSLYNITIIPVSPSSDNTKVRPLPANIQLDSGLTVPDSSYQDMVWRSRCRKQGRFLQEMLQQVLTFKFSWHNLNKALYYIRLGMRAAEYLNVHYGDILHRPEQPVTVYAYWLSHPGATASELGRLHPQIKTIARCHGYDCLPERHDKHHVPAMRYTTLLLDAVYPVSSYSASAVGRYKNRTTIQVAKLGSMDYGLAPLPENQPFTIVSCAYISPVKRLDLFVNALAKIKDVPLRWVHLGGGEQAEEITALAQNQLGTNIHWEITGNLPHDAIIEHYKNNPAHLFVNTSKSEGMPVSIMEALSFGLPVLATSAGGIQDAVTHGLNGFLLNNNASAESIAEEILRITNIPKAEYAALRNNARLSWQQNYNAAVNFPKFYEMITQ